VRPFKNTIGRNDIGHVLAIVNYIVERIDRASGTNGIMCGLSRPERDTGWTTKRNGRIMPAEKRSLIKKMLLRQRGVSKRIQMEILVVGQDKDNVWPFMGKERSLRLAECSRAQRKAGDELDELHNSPRLSNCSGTSGFKTFPFALYVRLKYLRWSRLRYPLVAAVGIHVTRIRRYCAISPDTLTTEKKHGAFVLLHFDGS
jgi:hypothetical protein